MYSFRYKEKQFNHVEETVHVLPNLLKQNIVIRRLKPCSVYELRIRMKFQGKGATFLRLDDFDTGPNNQIKSLKVRNLTDRSTEIIWNPKEDGMQCATSFTIKGNLASFEVKPSNVLTLWESLKSCQEYAIQVSPKFGEKVGQYTSVTFVTFPSHNFFDAWIDESKQLIVWHTNQAWDPCKESITNIRYEFELVKCSSHQPDIAYSPVVVQTGASSEYAIKIDELQKKIAKKVDIVQNYYYNVNLKANVRNNKDQTMAFDILANLLFRVNGKKQLIMARISNRSCELGEEDLSNKSTMEGYHNINNNSLNHEKEYYNNPTLILVICTTSILLMVMTFCIYVLKNRVKKNVNDNILNRLSNNMAPHYVQYFKGPMHERISIINN